MQQYQPQSVERPENSGGAYHNMKDSRIPQPSIINSATGNMNLKLVNGETEQPYLSHNSNSNVNLNLSKSHIVDTQIIHNSAKTPTNQTNGIRGLQNPRIMKNTRDSENQNISNQASQRYLHEGIDSQKKVSTINRKTSHNNNSSITQGGAIRGMRSSHGMTNSSSVTGTSRYSQGNGNVTQNAHRRIEQQLRNVQLDKRLNELKQA